MLACILLCIITNLLWKTLVLLLDHNQNSELEHMEPSLYLSIKKKYGRLTDISFNERAQCKKKLQAWESENGTKRHKPKQRIHTIKNGTIFKVCFLSRH